MNNDQLMARMATLPPPDFLHATKLGAPIGSHASYRADAVARLIEQAIKDERERCAQVCERRAKEIEHQAVGARAEEYGEAMECADAIRNPPPCAHPDS